MLGLSKPTDNKVVKDVPKQPLAPLTIENVIKELRDQDVRHPEIVFRQIEAETGYLTSKRAIKDNNLFGLRTSRYLKFNSWQESISYYKHFQDKKYKGGDYYQFLIKVKYAEDSNYVTTLKSIQHSRKVKQLLKQYL